MFIGEWKLKVKVKKQYKRFLRKPWWHTQILADQLTLFQPGGTDDKPFHLVRRFSYMDVMTKVRYFLIIQIHDLGTLEVEYDLVTFQRP